MTPSVHHTIQLQRPPSSDDRGWLKKWNDWRLVSCFNQVFCLQVVMELTTDTPFSLPIRLALMAVTERILKSLKTQKGKKKKWNMLYSSDFFQNDSKFYPWLHSEAIDNTICLGQISQLQLVMGKYKTIIILQNLHAHPHIIVHYFLTETYYFCGSKNLPQ